MSKRAVVILFLVAGFFLSARFVLAMTSTNYLINWDSMNSGGGDTSTSTNFGVRDTIGQQAAGVGTSTNYTLSAGYRAGDASESSLSFSLGTQENTTETTYSAFDASGKTVTVASVANFSVGDMIGVVENVGASQLIAVGKVEQINGNDLTVDQWDGVPNLLSASPSGGDDFVYRMNGSDAQLGALDAASVKTSLTATRITTNSSSGYTVYVNGDGKLRVSPSVFVKDVADGSVNAGSEEYGWQAFGTNATTTAMDLAFSTTTLSIQQSNSGAVLEDRVGLVYKISVDPSTPAGNYAQAVYYTATVNY